MAKLNIFNEIINLGNNFYKSMSCSKESLSVRQKCTFDVIGPDRPHAFYSTHESRCLRDS